MKDGPLLKSEKKRGLGASYLISSSSKVVGKHVTEMNGAIAQDLIKNGLMKRRACKNFNILKIQRFYEVRKDIFRSSLLVENTKKQPQTR